MGLGCQRIRKKDDEINFPLHNFGDLQIGAQLVDGLVDCVIFLRDPMTPQPHEPDINALVRACDVHNVPCATNVSTARLVLSQLMRGRGAGPA